MDEIGKRAVLPWAEDSDSDRRSRIETSDHEKVRIAKGNKVRSSSNGILAIRVCGAESLIGMSRSSVLPAEWERYPTLESLTGIEISGEPTGLLFYIDQRGLSPIRGIEDLELNSLRVSKTVRANQVFQAKNCGNDRQQGLICKPSLLQTDDHVIKSRAGQRVQTFMQRRTSSLHSGSTC